MRSKRVALIGLGVMGINHARVLQKLNGVELIAVYDSLGTSTVNQSALPLVTSIEEVIRLRPDYCVIATPTSSHETIAMTLLEHNINVLIEKPIALDSRASQRIIDKALEKRLVGGVGHIERFNPALIEAKKRIDVGEIGQVYQITSTRIGPNPQRIRDVGVSVDLATHDIDVARWLTDSEYEHISAQIFQRSGIQKEELLCAVGKLSQGIIVNHVGNWLSPVKVRTTFILGELGAFEVDTLNSDLILFEKGSIPVLQADLARFKGSVEGQKIQLSFEKPEPLLIEHQEFLNAINGLESNYVSLTSAHSNLIVAEAIVESAANMRMVTL